MKKFGKYEKQPVEVAQKPQKPQKQKNLLLQTYLTSMLSLLLCVAMFFGTSYAWFTSEVENTENEIYVGTLKVGFNKITEDEQNKEVPVSLASSDTKLFDKEIRWEPGYTSLETVEVVNLGDLAFDYVMHFTKYEEPAEEGVVPLTEQELVELAKNFEVWTYAYKEGETPAEVTAYTQITAEGSGWQPAGNLADLLAGKVVLSGEMKENRVRDEDEETEANDGTTDGVETANRHTIALHMIEGANEDVMGKRFKLNVKLIAYQKGAEEDGFGNGTYDQMVATEEALKTAFANGGTVALASDIELTETGLSVPAGKTVILDLNGHTIHQSKECTASYALITNNGTLTINDTSKNSTGKISLTDTGVGDSNFAWGSYAIRNEGTLVVNGGTIECKRESDGAHCSLALYQYSGSTTINGGKFINEAYRSVCLRKGDMTINGGDFIGQVWAQCVDNSAKLTITTGTFTPRGGDLYSVFVDNNDNYDAELSVTGGTFNRGIGCNKVTTQLIGCITGGTFEGTAKQDTNSVLFKNP